MGKVVLLHARQFHQFHRMTTVQLFQPPRININLQLPTQWNELHRHELSSVATALLLADKMPPRAFLLKRMMEYRAKLQRIRLPRKLFGKLNPEDAVINGYPLLDFIFAENNLTQQPYNRIKLPGLYPCTVYGPHSGFDNLTVCEYEDAFFFYNQFKCDPLIIHLATMAAILWRKKNKPYLVRNKSNDGYSTYNHTALLPRFRRLPVTTLFTMYLWFEGCQQQLQKIFYEVYNQPANDAAADGGDGFTRAIHAAAGPKNGTRAQVRCLLIKEFLYDAQLEIINHRNTLQEYEQLQRK